MDFSVHVSTPTQGIFYCLTPETEALQNFQDLQKEFRTNTTAVEAILLGLPCLSSCLDAVEQKCEFTGDAAILILSWVLAAAETEREWDISASDAQPQLPRYTGQRQQTAINQLLKSSQLSQRERGFLTSLQGKRSLSPKQQETLSRIEVEKGGQH